ncbi:MAG TPA: isocitrate dehydrogenase kinase/phosphatase AceK regulatory subunit, partial [Burkholderiaceae bacterium]|nr:isocitrate dehydrogenase kinase/phosphatase AceK regulatory subunit [Burkholderiaceae bacterium]
MNSIDASADAISFDRSMPSPSAIARAILDGFDNHYRRFRYVAQQAKALYENGNWHTMRERARERIDFYDSRVLEAAAIIERDFDLDSLTDAERDALWQTVKQNFVALLADHRQPECAETFFNSVCTKLLHRDYFRNRFIFVRPGVATEYMDSDPPSYRSYYPATDGLNNVLRRIIIDFGLACPWDDVERDIRRVIKAVIDARRTGAAFPRPWHIEPDFQVQLLSNLFFRNKGAYVVGRVINGTRITPVAVPILRDSRGALYIDAALFTTDLLSVLFSFTHAYFLVDMEAPAAYVDFLRSILPTKPASEIY